MQVSDGKCRDPKALLEPVLSQAIVDSRLFPAEERVEFIALTLIATVDRETHPQGAQIELPEVPELDDDEEMPSVPANEAEELDAAIEAAYKQALTQHGQSDFKAHDLMRTLGEQLCPKAGRIPPDAFRTLYTKCDEVPYIIQVDTFLAFPGPDFHYSLTRQQEAKRQSWELIRLMWKQGKCNRLVLTSGNPAVGKSTWIEKCGMKEPNLETCVFFDDLLNSKRRRAAWWEAFKSSGLPLEVEIVAITRNFDMSIASNEIRGAKGGHRVPVKTMSQLWLDWDPPTVAEGFSRVRIYENEHDENIGAGEYVLKHEEVAEGAQHAAQSSRA